MPIDFSKPVKTRDGTPVTIVYTDGRNPYPIIGYLGKDKYITTWTKEGKFSANSGWEGPKDLINVPDEPKQTTIFVCLMKNKDGFYWLGTEGHNYEVFTEDDLYDPNLVGIYEVTFDL